MAMARDKLLLVGAGPVGLAMAKALKAHAIAYDQVDAGDGVGGNWRHSIPARTHIVSSKTATAFADTPMPADYPDFPSCAQMLRYLEAFAVNNGLMSAIETRRIVARAAPRPDEAWDVTFADGETRTYKGVVVCSGHHWDKKLPSYPGTFTGRLIHSRDYTGPDELKGQRTLVMGGGNSGCDAVCEAAEAAASCDWSLRSGYWFLPKMAFGRPLTDLPIWNLPMALQRTILKGIVRMIVGRYETYGLPHPGHRMFERHPTYNIEPLGLIRKGKIRPRPDIARWQGKTVTFKDGTSGEYDVIVAGTGFHNSVPFLPDGLISQKNGALQIYSGAFPASAKNLYVIGSNQPRGGFGTLVTPAANLYAKLIAMQDEIAAPIGAILAYAGDTLPVDNLVDPGRARREMWLGNRMLWLLKLNAKRYARARDRDIGRARRDALLTGRPLATPAPTPAPTTATNVTPMPLRAPPVRDTSPQPAAMAAAATAAIVMPAAAALSGDLSVFGEAISTMQRK